MANLKRVKILNLTLKGLQPGEHKEIQKEADALELKEKVKRAAALVIANIELAFQNVEKAKREILGLFEIEPIITPQRLLRYLNTMSESICDEKIAKTGK